MVVVKVVHVKHKLHLLVKLRAVDSEQPGHEFPRVKIAITVDIEDRKKSLGDQSRQLAVVQEADFINSFRLVITAAAQVLIDVFEVGQADLHLEVVRLSWL